MMTVEEAWRLLKIRMEGEGASLRLIDSARVTFAAGVYAASHDVLMNRASPGDLSEAAARVEKHR